MALLRIWDETTQAYVGIPAIRGAQGPKGDAYVLTAQDRETIVQAVLAALPSADGEVY